MNIDRHLSAHREMFQHLVEGDGESAGKQRAFYDEYLAVMDMTAEFYLQTVDLVFVKHALPKGEMTHGGKPVDLSAIRRVALMTVEGERDDICGRRPDEGGARPLPQYSPAAEVLITCSGASATTAYSTAPASARRSCRKSWISTSTWKSRPAYGVS